MHSTNENNRITKKMALEFMRNVRRQDRDYVIEALVRCVLYGGDYPEEKRYGQMEVSYFCRAFNITEYDASKQKNRIKGRYKKYVQIPGVEAFLRKTLKEQWPGYHTESPRMDDLLRAFANGTIPPPPGPDPDTTGNEERNRNFFDDDFRRTASGHGSLDPAMLRRAAGWAAYLILLVLAVSLLRSCGHSGSGGSSVLPTDFFSAVKDFFIKILSWAITLCILAVPAIVFFTSCVWRKIGRLAGGGILYLMAWSCFCSGIPNSLLFAVLFWAAGVCVWVSAK